MFNVITALYITKYTLEQYFSKQKGICDQILRNVNLNKVNCFCTERVLDYFKIF